MSRGYCRAYRRRWNSAWRRWWAPVGASLGLLAAQQPGLARAVRHTRVRLTVTSTLDHAIPSLSLSDIADLFRFNGWAVRLMQALRANRLTLNSAIGLLVQARSPTAGTARIGHLKHF